MSLANLNSLVSWRHDRAFLPAVRADDRKRGVDGPVIGSLSVHRLLEVRRLLASLFDCRGVKVGGGCAVKCDGSCELTFSKRVLT